MKWTDSAQSDTSISDLFNLPKGMFNVLFSGFLTAHIIQYVIMGLMCLKLYRMCCTAQNGLKINIPSINNAPQPQPQVHSFVQSTSAPVRFMVGQDNVIMPYTCEPHVENMTGLVSNAQMVPTHVFANHNQDTDEIEFANNRARHGRTLGLRHHSRGIRHTPAVQEVDTDNDSEFSRALMPFNPRMTHGQLKISSSVRDAGESNEQRNAF